MPAFNQIPPEPTKPIPAKAMHKIVFSLVGIFALFAITYPTAMYRVSQNVKYQGSHVKSLTPEYKPIVEAKDSAHP